MNKLKRLFKFLKKINYYWNDFNFNEDLKEAMNE